jgi:hypothetical protein
MRKLKIRTRQIENTPLPAAIRIGWLTHLFGCWHQKMGNPFTRGNQTYCACRECGACRKFDMIRWESVGPYYYNPILALYDTPLKPKRSCDVNISVFEVDRWAEDGGRN